MSACACLFVNYASPLWGIFRGSSFPLSPFLLLLLSFLIVAILRKLIISFLVCLWLSLYQRCNELDWQLVRITLRSVSHHFFFFYSAITLWRLLLLLSLCLFLFLSCCRRLLLLPVSFSTLSVCVCLWCIPAVTCFSSCHSVFFSTHFYLSFCWVLGCPNTVCALYTATIQKGIEGGKGLCVCVSVCGPYY